MRGRVFLVALVGLAICPGVVSSQTAKDSAGSDQHASVTSGVAAEALLTRSYLVGKRLLPEERAFQLTRLAQTASTIQPVLTRLWAEELFQSAMELPMTWNRVAAEKNAVTALAAVDPVRAFELFGTMDDPVPMLSGGLPEDVRAFGARIVLPQFWKREGSGSLDDIRRAAQHVGDTGQYPYMGMAPIIRDLLKLGDIRADSLLSEALAYYTQPSRFRASDKEFVQLLGAVWDVAPLSWRREALSTAVAHLTGEAKPPEAETFRARLLTEKGVAEFKSASQRLLFELLPKVREIDPDWARRLVESHPEIGQASAAAGGVKFSEEVTVHNVSGASPARVDEVQGTGLQRSRLANIRGIAQTDPEQALRLSSSLSDSLFRLEALSSVATALAGKDPERARGLIAQAKEAINKIQDTSGRVTAWVALAEAAAAAHDSKTFEEAIKRGFDLGEEVFEEDLSTHPGKPSYELAAMDDLGRLTQVGVHADRERMLGRVTDVRNPLLQAHLLIDAAEALNDLQKAEAGAHNHT